MNRLMIIGCVVLSTLNSFGSIRALTHDPWGGKAKAWQLARHHEKLGVVTNGGAKVVFIGDSITHFWETNGDKQRRRYFAEGDYKMLNLGTSGDRTEHVLWRLNEGGELDGYEAKCVLLMIGSNNTGHRKFEAEPPSDTILGIRKILKTIRAKQPKAVIVLQAIFPRGVDATDECRRRNDIVNREIMKFADGKTIFWCDLTDDFLTPEGILPRELFPDALHPSALGYEIWYSAVKPYIDYALADGRLPAPVNRYARPRVGGGMRMNEAKTVYPATRIGSDGDLDDDWWLDRLELKRKQITNAKGEFDLVLFGDSITHFWEDAGQASRVELKKRYSIFNIGYSGDCTEHLVWRGLNGELTGYKAKCIMLMIGTNNVGNDRDKPAAVAQGVKRVLEVIAEKQPEAKTLLLPIFPRGDAKDKVRAQNEKVNEIIKGFADGEKVIWVDFNAKFLDANGDTEWVMPDRLHPNAKGYSDIWLPAVKPYLQKIIGR